MENCVWWSHDQARAHLCQATFATMLGQTSSPPCRSDSSRLIWNYWHGQLHVSRPALSSLLNGKADLSGNMALRIEKAFGVKMDTLMRMQASYDIAQTREANPYSPDSPASERSRMTDVFQRN